VSAHVRGQHGVNQPLPHLLVRLRLQILHRQRRLSKQTKPNLTNNPGKLVRNRSVVLHRK
jgi:hypothetical protein